MFCSRRWTEQVLEETARQVESVKSGSSNEEHAELARPINNADKF